jgi:hypothetical protein
MRWTDPSKGAEQLCGTLLKGRLWWASPTCVQGVTNFVYGPAQRPWWYQIDLARGSVEGMQLRCPLIDGVTFHNGALLAFSRQKVIEVNPSNGAPLSELAIPASLTHRDGRFFVDRQGAWHAISHDGQRPTLDTLPPFKIVNDPVTFVWEAAVLKVHWL